jgi:thymidylate synthase (FAD)
MKQDVENVGKNKGGDFMKIELLHYTPIEPIIKATAMPYQSKENKGLVKRVFESGHRSIVRHGMASFLVKDVSQSLLRQISRHPHINLTVKSTRYCDMSDTNFYIPDIEYEADLKKIMVIYKKWKDYEGNEKEVDVAKQFLPLASTTDLVVSGNYQALYEFCQLRNCVRAESEIRELSLAITKTLKKIIPEIFDNLGCKGDEYKICPENHGSCGKYPIKKELMK